MKRRKRWGDHQFVARKTAREQHEDDESATIAM
jgi:hypothetical protein